MLIEYILWLFIFEHRGGYVSKLNRKIWYSLDMIGLRMSIIKVATLVVATFLHICGKQRNENRNKDLNQKQCK